LSNAKGDRYLQAAAIETLFQGNPELALDYMKEQAQKCERYILNTIMELMIENKDDFKSGIALSVSRLISERIKKVDDEQEFLNAEVRDSFLSLYSPVENVQC
jgi:hypothetical protein